MTEGYDYYEKNTLAERVNGILKDESLFGLFDDLAPAHLLVQQAVGHGPLLRRRHAGVLRHAQRKITLALQLDGRVW